MDELACFLRNEEENDSDEDGEHETAFLCDRGDISVADSRDGHPDEVDHGVEVLVPIWLVLLFQRLQQSCEDIDKLHNDQND